jgi:hypothetical protein
MRTGGEAQLRRDVLHVTSGRPLGHHTAPHGRPPLSVGTYGRLDFHHAASGRVRARARFRDFDGVLRPVTRWGSSDVEAGARLLATLRERAFFPEGEMAAGARLAAASRVWLAEVDQSDLAAGTNQLYRAAARIYLVPTLGQVRLGELNVALIERAVASIRVHHGAQSARAARRALSSLCRTAVRHGAIGVQPGPRHPLDRLSTKARPCAHHRRGGRPAPSAARRSGSR